MARQKEWDDWNQGKMPLVGFNFMLRVELIYDLPCKSVHQFTRDLEYEYIQEGGLNDYVHMRRKPISKPFELEIERYVGVDYVDPLPLGTDLVLPLMLLVSRAPNQFEPQQCARTYVFTGCTVTGKTYGALEGSDSQLLVETTRIAYREMLCVDAPWNTLSEHTDEGRSITPPGNAVTEYLLPKQLKQEGQDWYEKAKAAKALADEEYDADSAKKIKAALDEAGKALEQSVKSGQLANALTTAQQAEKDPSGKPYSEIAAELRSRLARCEDALQDVTQQWDDVQKQQADEKRKELIKKLKDALDGYAETIPELNGTIPDVFETSAPDTQQQAVQKALQALEKAAQDARAGMEQAQEKQAAATKEVAAARQAKERAEKLLTSIKNNEANLDVWVEHADTALKDGETAFGVCEEHNQKLQALKDDNNDDLQEIRKELAEVKTSAQTVIRQEQQVRQTCQYLQVAQELSQEANALLAGLASAATA